MVVCQKFANVLKTCPPASRQNYSSTLKMKAVCSSKTSVILYLATWHKIQENNNLHNKPHNTISVLLTNHLSLIIWKVNYHEPIERSFPPPATSLFKFLLVGPTKKKPCKWIH